MLTIDIDDKSVNLTVYQGRRVRNAVSAFLEDGLVQDGVVVDISAVGRVITDILGTHKITEKEVYASVSGVHSIYRVVYVPNIEKSLLAEAARREMERASPVPLESLYSSWHDIRISRNEIALCLSGIPRDNIDSVTGVIKEAGLRLKWLELRPLAVARVPEEGTAIIIDVRESGFDIVIKDRGIPELIRSLSFSSSTMNDQDKVSQIKEEAARTISFYNSSHRERLIGSETPCYLSGGLKDSLSQTLGYVIKPMPEIMSYPAEVDADVFCVNTGLAVRQNKAASKYMQVGLNVIPGIPTAGAAPEANLVPLVAFAIGAVIVASTFFITQAISRETMNLQTQVNEKTKLVTEAQKQLKEEVDKLKKELDNSKQAVNALKTPIGYLDQQRVRINTELGGVISALPATMYLTAVSSDNVVMNVEGIAPNESMVVDYARDLRYSGLYSLVIITNVENRDYSEIFYKINLILRR
jgi:type IV pilus assembly protein PilM